MAGASIDIDVDEISRMLGVVVRGRRKAQRSQELMHGLASLLEQQTKRRISDEKTAPDGTPWKPWSDDYAKTRKPHHSLLIDTQNLLDSIYGISDRGSATVGSELVYAGPQNADRPFLGLSDENKTELEEAVKDWLRGLVA